MTAHTQALEARARVTQVDREIAASVLPPHVRDSVLRGEHDHTGECAATVQAFARHRTTHEPRPAGDLRENLTDRFWLIVREPGMVPDQKGPWPHRDTAKVMREFIEARPRAFIDVLTIGPDGTPDVQHGPEALQMADARSMSTGSKHNARVRAAVATHSPAPTEARVPADVRRLVIAARGRCYGDDTLGHDLDAAVEAFATRVPWDDEPDAHPSTQEGADRG